jgi:hypothetical protein
MKDEKVCLISILESIESIDHNRLGQCFLR